MVSPEMEQHRVPTTLLLHVQPLRPHVGPLQLHVGPLQPHAGLLQAPHQASSLDLLTAAQKSPTVAKITTWSGQFFLQPMQDWI